MKSLFTADVTSAFAADVNHLPAIRASIKETFPELPWEGHEAAIESIKMQSASAFKVSVNGETTASAYQVVDGLYEFKYEGSVAYIVFDASTTLTYFGMGWFVDRENHKVVEITPAPSAVKTMAGITVPADADGNYELAAGWYTITTSGGEETVYWNGKPTIDLA